MPQTRYFWSIIHKNSSKHPLSTDLTKHLPSLVCQVLFTGEEIYWEWLSPRYLPTCSYLVLAKMNPSTGDWLPNPLNVASCSHLVSGVLNPDHKTMAFFLPEK